MPSGLAISPGGELFVSDGYCSRRVHKFSPEGELLLSWGSPGEGPGEFAFVHNLAVDPTVRVFVCDRENDRIQIFDADGGYLKWWTDLPLPGDLYIRDGVAYVVEQGDRGGVSI